MKTKRLLSLISNMALLLLPAATMGQTTVTNSGPVTISGTGPVFISGNITNDQAGMTPGAGITRLAGAAVQTVSGGQDFVTNKLMLTNSSGYALNQGLEADGTVTFTNGIITSATASTPMIFGSSATLSGVSNTSHVNGYMRYMGTSLFACPVGDGTNYRRVDITPGANAAGIDCRYYKVDAGSAPFTGGGTDPVPLVAYDKAEYWDLLPVSTATATVTIYYDQVVPPGTITSTSDLKVAHLSGGSWLDEGGVATGTTSAGNITSNAVVSFGSFTLGSTSPSSPLPVVLISFSGSLAGNAVQLNWEVADEVDLRSYGVEKSCNGIDYTIIGEVPATNSHFYQYTDAAISCQKAFYRLRMEDIGGNYNYGYVVVINTAGGNGIQVMPNPVESQLNIRFGTGMAGTYTIFITDALGRKFFSSELTVSDGETISLARPPQLQTGIYILSLAKPEKGTVSNFKILVK